MRASIMAPPFSTLPRLPHGYRPAPSSHFRWTCRSARLSVSAWVGPSLGRRNAWHSIASATSWSIIEQTGPADAPLLVFVNSLGTDLRVWDALLPRLADRFCCVRYDKRGHGLTDATPGPYSIDGLAEDLARLLDARGAKGVLVCGLSIGGMIAQALTAARPDLVRGLVLMDTAHKIGTAEMWSERIDAIRAGGIGSIADAILSRWFSASFHRDRPDELAGWRNMLTRTPLDGYLACCAAIRDADLTAAARSDRRAHPVHGRRPGRLDATRAGGRARPAHAQRPAGHDRGRRPSALRRAARCGGRGDAGLPRGEPPWLTTATMPG